MYLMFDLAINTILDPETLELPPTLSNRVVRFASSPGKSLWDFCSLVYSGGLSRVLDVNSVEIKDSSASCHQEIKLLISPVKIQDFVFSG
ncbi:hypothetical protein GQ457_01G023980 [Hibiscus cannabinus]